VKLSASCSSNVLEAGIAALAGLGMKLGCRLVHVMSTKDIIKRRTIGATVVLSMVVGNLCTLSKG
jgi:hypothetical protein